MDPLPVLYVLSRLAGIAGLLLIFPLLLALFDGQGGSREIVAYLVPLAISGALFLLSRRVARTGRVDLRDSIQGFQCVVLGWLLFALIGALPFWISGALPQFVDAWFEAMSGFTTTGASVFTSVEEVPRDLLLWRAMTQFIGGLGIIALFVAVLPALGAGGVLLFRSEVSTSILQERLRPRIKETARILWMIYCGLCVLEFVALLVCGVPAFDSVCHSLATISTGGFSTQDISLAAYSPAAQWIVTLFMFLGATSFVLHGRALSGDLKAYLRSEEFRLFVAILTVAITLLTLIVMFTAAPIPPESISGPPSLDPATHDEAHFATAVRDSAFQVMSIMTSTGFASTDYDRWPDSARFLLILLMFIGGCAGSTAGGVKVFRLLLIFRTIASQIVTMISPSRIVTVRYGGDSVPRHALIAATVLLLLFLVLSVFGALALMLMGVHFEEALSGTVACLTCVGPALGDFGPTGNYAEVPAAGKVILAVLMLMGRLELYAVLVLLGSVRRRSR